MCKKYYNFYSMQAINVSVEGKKREGMSKAP